MPGAHALPDSTRQGRQGDGSGDFAARMARLPALKLRKKLYQEAAAKDKTLKLYDGVPWLLTLGYAARNESYRI